MKINAISEVGYNSKLI